MRALALLVLMAVTLAACAPVPPPEPAERRAGLTEALPPMKVFAHRRGQATRRSNAEIARDFMELTFQLESGRTLPRLTRFEEPVTVRVVGEPAPSLYSDLNHLVARIRREAGIGISVVDPDQPANITVEIVPRATLRRAVPQAACFVVPRLTSWGDFLRNRRSGVLDWRTLERRDKVAIFIPTQVSPQEVRDCLHEELAQALGPLNDLYRLTDSVFNDDNFHNVLTGFDMLMLKVFYDRELASGMGPAEVAARLPAILRRLNPRGERAPTELAEATTRDWINAIETALGPGVSLQRRRIAARRAIEIAEANAWLDNRLGFSLFAYGRLSLNSESDTALALFLQANAVYSARPETRLQAAHVAMQLAAFALSAGQADTAIRIVDDNLAVVQRSENASLLATLLMIKSEALRIEGRDTEARSTRRDALGWARYGFSSEAEIRRRLGEILQLAPDARQTGDSV